MSFRGRPRSLVLVAIASYLLFLVFHFFDAQGDVAVANEDRVQRLAHSLQLQLLKSELAIGVIARTTEMTGKFDGARLMQAMADEAELGRMVVIDSDGVIRADSLPGRPHVGVDVSDRDYYFRFLDSSPPEGLFIGDALVSRGDQAHLIPLATAARDGSGRLIAVVASALDALVMDALLKRSPEQLAPGETVAIRRAGGALLLCVQDGVVRLDTDPRLGEGKADRLGVTAAVSDFPLTVSLIAPPGRMTATAAIATAPGATLALFLLLMALLMIRLREHVAQRRAATQELERSRLSELLELSGHRFWEIDAAGLCVAARGAWSNGDPIDPEDYIGLRYAEITTRINDAGSVERIASAIDAGRPFSRLPVTVTSSDGERGQAALSGAPLISETGAHEGWRLVAIDVTEQVRAAELKTTLSTKTRLIAAISHDMRQPIQALMLFLGIARDSAADPKAQEMIERSTEIAGNLTRQIGALADLGRVESEMIRPHLLHTDIRPLLARTAAEQAAIAAARGVEVRTVLPDAEVVTDPVLLERVIDNILNNAVKFARQRVLIGARRHGPHFLIEIMDDGPGVAPDHREDIFHAWARRDLLPRTGVEGTGIGLAVSRQIAEALGVAIRLKSRPGRGARFTLELPAEPHPHTAQRHPARHDFASVVLAVDDDPAIRAALTAALSTDSRTVFAYPSGEAALASDLDGLRPDAFVIDLNLGDGMDGGRLIRRLMDRPGGDAPAYFVLSGEPPETVERLLGDLPVRAVLRKPIRLEHLQTAIDAVTDGGAGSP